ncbi:MAG: hypothetical protein ACTS3R_02835 [Inquilinaceae bacterium]
MDALRNLTDMNLSMHGWIALAVGIVGVAVVNGGLMYLVLKSRDRDPSDRR